MLGHPMQILARHRCVFLVGVLVITAIVPFVLLSNGPGTAAKASVPLPPSHAGYRALGGTGPTGLPIATPGSPAALAAKGPSFPANPPAGMASHGPVATSIRRLPISLPNVSAWIGTNAEGGICVLAARHQPALLGAYGLGIGCAPAALRESGAYLELQADGRKTAIVGVVPDNVSSVQLTFTDGSKETVPTPGNAWALETDAHLENTRNVVGSERA